MTDTIDGPQERSPVLVAVLAVHGVADQQPGGSAREVATLLSDLNDAAALRYAMFEEQELRIDVGRPACSEAGESQTFYHRATAAEDPDATTHTLGHTHPGILMMHDQLLQYSPTRADRTYNTIRLRTTRRGDDGRPETSVDVYEMYWADLSRLGRGALRVLGELYQLLLHVPSLGRHAVDAAAVVDAAGDRRWRRLRQLQRRAAWFLTVPIPLLSLWLLVCVLVGMSGALVLGRMSSELQPLPPVLILAVALLYLSSTRLVRRRLVFGAWPAMPIVLLIAAAVSYRLVQVYQLAFYAFALEVVALAWVGGAWLVSHYAIRRPAADGFGGWSLAVVCLGLIGTLTWLRLQPRHGGDPIANVLTAALWIAELLYPLLMLCWALFFVLQFGAWIQGAVARRRPHRSPEAALRLRRANRTARLTLAIPAVSFIVLTMVMWAALYVALSAMAPEVPYPSIWLYRLAPASQLEHGTATHLLSHSAAAWQMLAVNTPELIVLLAFSGAGLWLALWGALPAVIAEVHPPSNDQVGAEPLGAWLDRGLRYMWLPGSLTIAASLLVAPMVGLHVAFRIWEPEMTALFTKAADTSVLGLDGAGTFLGWIIDADNSEKVLKGMGTLVAGAAIGVFLFSGRLKKVTAGARPVLDVLLDVDNYLREHPRANNPRARIIARYIATLRHLCAWRDDQGRGYGAIVIVAHSQGTVITADLLRFLRCYEEPGLADLRRDPSDPRYVAVRLFTMGSPLRQLYGLRFPHFYDWARHLDVAGCPDHHTSADRMPDPATLGVETWLNAYRSGDYIGRHLWHLDGCESVYRPTQLPNPIVRPPTLRADHCVGSGAHTHYWDGSAPAVSRLLDALF